MMLLMFHDDDCGELLDGQGVCPKCGFAPDMQSTGFREVSEEDLDPTRDYLGQYRRPVMRRAT